MGVEETVNQIAADLVRKALLFGISEVATDGHKQENATLTKPDEHNEQEQHSKPAQQKKSKCTIS